MTVSYFEPPSNFPGNSRSRLKPGTLWFRYLAEINLILGAWYLHWRFTQSLNFAALWLAIPLLIAEVYSYLGGVIFTIGLWRPLERQVRSLDQMRPHFTEAEYPTVDVFITCYNEPVEIIESTTRAALDLDYPIGRLQIYVLDDGNSSTVREMTHRLCMSDRYSERLRQHEVKLQTELTQLMQRFCQLEGFVPEIGEIQFLMAELKSTPSEEISTSHSLLLRNLCQMILLFNSDFQDLSEQLQREKQKLMSAIAQKEKELLQLTRCHYIARPKPIDRPHHAKAGNINYALFSGKCSGQFLVTLDTDHVLQPQFLKRVLPYLQSLHGTL
jgi:cellulose synthase (UDP-forming)